MSLFWFKAVLIAFFVATGAFSVYKITKPRDDYEKIGGMAFAFCSVAMIFLTTLVQK